MGNTQAATKLNYSFAEELVNAITHGIGAILSVVALTLMIIVANNSIALTSAIVYGSSMILLFLASTLYHAITHTPTKQVMKILDHCAIYLLIAGTYTPFMLISLQGTWGYTLLSVVWVLAAIGIYFKIVFKHRFKKISLITYLGMGWLVIIAMPEMITKIASGGLVLIASGGVAYTFGAVFYSIKKIPFNHAIWHVFVLVGSVCHFLAVYLYVIK